MIKLNENTFDRDINLIDEDDYQICKIDNMSCISMSNLDTLVIDPLQIGKIIANSNHLKEIEPTLLKFEALLYLELSMNHITTLANLQACNQLLELDLSYNRIEKLDDLNYLPDLRKLNISQNYISEVKELKTDKLQELNISGNSISKLFSLQNLHKLQVLNFSSNLISDFKFFYNCKLEKLTEIQGQFNQIPQNQCDILRNVVKELPALENVNFAGNQITQNKFYKYSILIEKKVKILDGVKISPSIYRNVIDSGKIKTFDEAVDKTNKDYYDRLKYENSLKLGAKMILKDQMRKIDDQFTKYQDQTLNQQLDFLQFIKTVEKNKIQGNKINIDGKQILDWQNHIEQQKDDIQNQYKQQQNQQLIQQSKYLNKAETVVDLRQKLYEISMKDPDLWRELKSKELMQLVREQQVKEQELNRKQYQSNKSLNSVNNYNNNSQQDILDQEAERQRIQDKLIIMEELDKNKKINKINNDDYRDQFSDYSQNNQMNDSQSQY